MDTSFELTSEVRAAETGVGWLDRDARDVLLHVEGRDRLRFLNGQCTQDLKSLVPGDGAAAMLLSAKGQVLALLGIYLREDSFALVFPALASAGALAHLQRFVVGADVRVPEATAAVAGGRLFGPDAPALLSALGLDVPIPPRGVSSTVHPRFGLVLVFREVRGGPDTFGLFATVAEAAALSSAVIRAGIPLGLSRLTMAGAEAVRVRALIPRFGTDLDAAVLPAESGLEALTVSYTKGCYSGQEVVAKQRYLGRPRKMLTALACSEGTWVLGDSVQVEGRTLGNLTSLSSVGPREEWRALAVLKHPELPFETAFEWCDSTGAIRGRGRKIALTAGC